MNKAIRSVLLATIALWAATMSQCGAQPFPIAAQLTIQQQGTSTLKGGVYTDKLQTVRVSSNYLLSLLAGVYSSDFPSGFPFGSRLVLVNFQFFQVENAAGMVLVTNTSPYLTYSDSFSQTNYLYQGREDTVKDSVSQTFFYRSTIEFNDPTPGGTSFTFSGNTMEKYSRSAADSTGYHLSQGSLAVSGTGSGRNGNSFFLMNGRITTPVVKWVE